MLNVKFVNGRIVLPANPVDKNSEFVIWKIVEDPITGEKTLIVNSRDSNYRFTKFIENSTGGVFLESQIADYTGPIESLGYVQGWFGIFIRGIVSLESTLLPGTILDLKQYYVLRLKNHLPIEDMVDSPLSNQITVDDDGRIYEYDMSDFIEELCCIHKIHDFNISSLHRQYNRNIKSLMDRYSCDIPNETY